MDDTPHSLDDLLNRGYRYALSLTHNSEAAQDLLQDACLRLSRRGGPWNIRYLITTIRNRHIDVQRRAAKIAFSPIEESDLIDEIDFSVLMVDPQLEAALDLLRAEEREMLFLSVVEEYSASEIATLTKKPRGTILSILHRTKKKLQKLLTEREDRAVR